MDSDDIRNMSLHGPCGTCGAPRKTRTVTTKNGGVLVSAVCSVDATHNTYRDLSALFEPSESEKDKIHNVAVSIANALNFAYIESDEIHAEVDNEENATAVIITSHGEEFIVTPVKRSKNG